MLTLYHHPMSAASRFVRLILGEYEGSANFVEIQEWERRDEFLALNPAGKVPVLIDDGHPPVVGRVPISEFLDETRGALKRERRLLPENPYIRAEARRVADWCLDKLENEVTRHITTERVFKRLMKEEDGGGAPDSRALRAARNNLKFHLQYLDWLSASRDWLAGDEPTYADMAAAATLSVLDYLGEVSWEDNAQLKDWYARLKSRPSFRPLLADKVKGLAPVSHYADLDF